MPVMQADRESGVAELHVYRAIVLQAPEAIILADRDGAIRVWNHGAEKIFGYAASEALGRNLDLIIPEHLRRAHWEGFDRAIAAGRTRHGGRAMTTRSMHKDGRKLYVELSFAVVTNDAGVVIGALGVGRDVTERRQAEKAHPTA